VKQKNNLDQTVLHAAAANNPESLQMILELLPKSDRLDAVKQKNNSDETVLHAAARNPESLRNILTVRHESALPLVAESATGKSQPSAFRT